MKSGALLALVICLVMLALPVGAQDGEPALSFALRAQTIQGPVAKAITPEAVRLAEERSVRQQLSPNFAKTSSRVGEGALVGFGIGALLGATVGQEACLHSPRWRCAVGTGTMFGAIGAVIAWLRSRGDAHR